MVEYEKKEAILPVLGLLLNQILLSLANKVSYKEGKVQFLLA
ncbi:hypothetical protein P20311_0599 [Pseudoalteromonas sp. BSi20311]|uniref:Uncharacterized protein n=1 Tax=Pseudoalteromonas issachenkonii TaxID=152297 RepID=A0ABM6N6N6_9GAMM|nr:hypothetical protein PSM_A2913 [Pseudoalteromonas sp. SM9913]ATC92009.1 hypothetical protein PISS_a3326 [Pseudoalteromonas issachenkonii]ATD04511.1 hypothetical protein PTET_a3307 [Pseudoalteromonas tetraodonis]GAA62826.1 hypothetical protein P20311_0599 [Pseudoalteromonas sp. BSi20311]